jgi:hypothetical protein
MRKLTVLLPLILFAAPFAGCGDSSSTDGGADLAHAPGDMAMTSDLTSTGDLASSGDLSSSGDLATVGDMASAGDLALGADMAPAGPSMAVITTSGGFGMGATGSLTTVALAGHKVTAGIDNTLDSDNLVRSYGGKVYVVNHTHGNVTLYDPAKGFMGPVQVATGDNVVKAGMTNPHDVVPIPNSTKAYVTLYNNDAAHAVGVIDFANPAAGVSKWITIPTAAKDPDGHPEANDLYLCNGFAYVSAQDLDEGKGFAPTGPSRLIALDVTKDAIDPNMGIIQLGGANPNGIAPDGSGVCTSVLVAEASNQFAGLDGTGGIDRVDLAQRKSLGLAIKDTDLKGHPYTISAKSKSLAFATLTINGGAGAQVVAIDPQGGKLLGQVTPPAGYIVFASVSPDGQLFVGVESPDMMSKLPKIGLYVGAADGSMINMMPLDLGQAPYSIAFF